MASDWVTAKRNDNGDRHMARNLKLVNGMATIIEIKLGYALCHVRPDQRLIKKRSKLGSLKFLLYDLDLNGILPGHFSSVVTRRQFLRGHQLHLAVACASILSTFYPQRQIQQVFDRGLFGEAGWFRNHRSKMRIIICWLIID